MRELVNGKISLGRLGREAFTLALIMQLLRMVNGPKHTKKQTQNYFNIGVFTCYPTVYCCVHMLAYCVLVCSHVSLLCIGVFTCQPTVYCCVHMLSNCVLVCSHVIQLCIVVFTCYPTLYLCVHMLANCVLLQQVIVGKQVNSMFCDGRCVHGSLKNRLAID